MLLIPSIELKGGKCLHAQSGDAAELARQWIKAGARRLHVVDVDSAASGKPVNVAQVKQIVAASAEVPVQVGGGMRSEETVAAYIESGVDFVVLGARAMTTPHFVNDLCLEYPGHIVVSLDVKAGKIAAEGWSKFADNDVIEVGQHFQREGAAAIVHTELGNGASSAQHIEAAALLARAITIPVIAGNGVATLADVRKLCAADGEGLLGAILGTALYDGALDLAAAQKLADSLSAKA
jgi:phosphoribosylformimino-5-aminoimidazole carboxamide ribotide isomerase